MRTYFNLNEVILLKHLQAHAHSRYCHRLCICTTGLSASAKCKTCAAESFVRGVPILTKFFYYFYFSLLVRGEDPRKLPLKVDHHQPASETPFGWRFAGGLMMAKH